MALAQAAVMFEPKGLHTGAWPFCDRMAFWKRLSEIEPDCVSASDVRA